MEKQNKLRAEAAKKKKEEAALKKKQQGQQPNDADQQKLSKLDTLKNKNKKFSLADEGGNQKQDVSEHFMADGFEATVDKIKLLSEESGMRKLNALKASKRFKQFIKDSESD